MQSAFDTLDATPMRDDWRPTVMAAPLAARSETMAAQSGRGKIALGPVSGICLHFRVGRRGSEPIAIEPQVFDLLGPLATSCGMSRRSLRHPVTEQHF
jgi:hypothetical protein